MVQHEIVRRVESLFALADQIEARRLWLAALCWAMVAGGAGASTALAGSAGPAFGDITFFIGSDLHYGFNLHTPTCDEISRGTLNRMNTLPGQAYPAAVGGGLVARRVAYC